MLTSQNKAWSNSHLATLLTNLTFLFIFVVEIFKRSTTSCILFLERHLSCILLILFLTLSVFFTFTYYIVMTIRWSLAITYFAYCFFILNIFVIGLDILARAIFRWDKNSLTIIDINSKRFNLNFFSFLINVCYFYWLHFIGEIVPVCFHVGFENRETMAVTSETHCTKDHVDNNYKENQNAHTNDQ